MKKTFVILSALIFVFGCQSKTDSKATSSTSETTSEKFDYAYLPDNHPPVYWEPGNQKNLVSALNALKAYETGKVDEVMTYFADSVQFTVDGFDAKIPNDTLKAGFTEAWKNASSIKVKMGDYESVISKDKKEEYVTLWFKEIVTDKAGKVDSLAYVDDIKFENGKIVSLDEKTRKYPANK
jgi:hypothetical protein